MFINISTSREHPSVFPVEAPSLNGSSPRSCPEYASRQYFSQALLLFRGFRRDGLRTEQSYSRRDNSSSYSGDLFRSHCERYQYQLALPSRFYTFLMSVITGSLWWFRRPGPGLWAWLPPPLLCGQVEAEVEVDCIAGSRQYVFLW